MNNMLTTLTTNKNRLLILLSICFLAKSTILHAVTITLSEAPYDWMPEFHNTVSIDVTIEGNLNYRHIVELKLSEVTNWPGVCMNDGYKTDVSPDLRMYPNQGDASDVTWTMIDMSHQSIQAEITPDANATEFTFTITITCFDFGAYGELSAIIYGPYGNSTSPLNSSNTITIPRDENGNKIADKWLFNIETDTDSDSETGPGGNSNDGDRFTVFEEYRGFFIMGGFTRLSLMRKDIFYYSFLDEGIGDGSNIAGDNPNTFSIHQVYYSEMDGGSRVMNSRQCPGYTYMEQRAIKIIKDNMSQPIEVDYAYGSAYPMQYYSSPNIPANMLYAIIYINSIESQLEKPEEAGKISRSEAISRIIGHEVGHHVDLEDDSLGSWNNDD